MAPSLSQERRTLQELAPHFIPFLWDCPERDHAIESWYLEVAVQDEDGGLNKSLFLAEPTVEDIERVIRWGNERGSSLYFGLLPRRVITTGIEPTEVGDLRRRAKREHVVHHTAPFTWLDLDPPKDALGSPLAHDIWRRQRLSDLLAMDLPPTVVVSSGNGLHAYWKLVDDDGHGWMPNYCVLLARGLAKRLGGDVAVAQPAALLRLPGSYHRKAEPRLVEIMHVGEPVGARAMMPYRDAGMRATPVLERRRMEFPKTKTTFCESCARRFAAWPPDDGAHEVLFTMTLACASHGWTEEEVIAHAQGTVDPRTNRPNRKPLAIERAVRGIYRRMEASGVRPFPCRARPRVVKGNEFHDPPMLPGKIVELESGRRILGERVSGFFEIAKSSFISAPTGLGKTRTLVRELVRSAGRKARRIVYCAPTRDGVRDARRELPKGASAIPVLFGRNEKEGGSFCAKKARMDRLVAKRRSLAAACRACELRRDCEWMQSFRRFMKSPIGFATHDAVASNPAVIEDAVIIVDEKLTGMLTRSVRVSGSDLRRYAHEVEGHGAAGGLLSKLARRLALAVEAREDLRGADFLAELEEEVGDLVFGAGIGVYGPFPWEEDLPEDVDQCAPALTQLLIDFAGLLERNPANVPVMVEGDGVTITLPNTPMLEAIKEGRVLAADATAPVELVERLGFDMEVLRFDDEKHIEVTGIAGKTYGSGSQEEVVRIARNFLSLGGGVVCRKAEAAVLRGEIPEKSDFILHYGVHRGSNAFYKAGVWKILVTRWMKNPRALRHEARTWAVLLGERAEIPEVDFSGEGLGFPGTEWKRMGAGMPRNEILRAVVEQDRREILQAIGRLRAPLARRDELRRMAEEEEWEPEEDEVGRLQVYVLDGFPVPGLVYEEVLGGEDGAGGEIEFYQHLVHRGIGDTTKLSAEVERLMAEKESRLEDQMAGTAAANAARQRLADEKHRWNAIKIRNYERRHPGAKRKELMAELDMSAWELRKARDVNLDDLADDDLPDVWS